MEIIKLQKKCNKKDKKVLQPKALSKSDEPKKAISKSDEPKKVSEPINDPSEEEQKPKKASSDGKKTTTKTGKKAKRTPETKKAPKPPEFVDTDTNDEQGPAVKCIVMYSTEDEQEPTVKKKTDGKGCPRMIKSLLCWG